MTTALFVCVHNAGRSQMAAAIFNSLTQRLGIPVSAESAGTEPSDRVHPNVVSVMDEWELTCLRTSLSYLRTIWLRTRDGSLRWDAKLTRWPAPHCS